MRPAGAQAIRWRLAELPEIKLAAWGLVLNASWEYLHSPLYRDGDREFTYIVWTRLHCSVGDALILLMSFWITALFFRTRFWYVRRPWPPAIMFVALGVSYTVGSEWFNTTVRNAWEYSAAMPQLAGIGLTPLLQWLILPPILILVLRTGSCSAVSR